MMKLLEPLSPLLLTLAALLTSASPAAAPWPDEPGAPGTPGTAGSNPGVQPSPFDALRPGELPADTAPAAEAKWKALIAAATPSKAVAPVKAFDLEFEGRVYQEGQTNDFDGRYRFLKPGFVRTLLTESGRETMRGPDGDWLVFADGRKVRLEGKDYELDVDELNRTVGVAQSFVALTDPNTIRIQRLELLSETPSSIPKGLRKRVGKLDWLVLHTPDFRLESDPPPGFGGAAPVLHRIELGLNPATHLPTLAVVGLAVVILRAISVRVTWRRSSIRHLDDEPA